ncbi:MAG: hypothetical protein K2O36_03255 [Ruminococcus sp.]|nr:hypothetical protein [Ruminococcus sp.]
MTADKTRLLTLSKVSAVMELIIRVYLLILPLVYLLTAIALLMTKNLVLYFICCLQLY